MAYIKSMVNKYISMVKVCVIFLVFMRFVRISSMVSMVKFIQKDFLRSISSDPKDKFCRSTDQFHF